MKAVHPFMLRGLERRRAAAAAIRKAARPIAKRSELVAHAPAALAAARPTEITMTKAVDRRIGVAMGFLFTSLVDGEPYYDHHGHYIPESEILPSALYMSRFGAMDVMHDRRRVGTVPFIWPYTTEFAKALGHDKPRLTGLLVGVMPDDKRLLDRVEDGTFPAFSLDGTAYEMEN